MSKERDEVIDMILFLDFDGVLHPIYNRPTGTDFSKLPLLEDWLRNYPHVNVVISSSWREVMDLEDLQHIFSRDIRHRVIDKCPIIPSDQATEHWRHAEIMAWIENAKYAGPWLALDDAVDAFQEDCYQLVICESEIGIDDSVIQELTNRSR